jgi:CBS domain containing-hemolysin-like protein
MIWIAVSLCLLVSFVFSGIEAGVLSVNRVRLRHRVKQRDRAAITLNRLLAKPGRVLVTVLIVTNLMNVFAITLTTGELVRLLGQWGYAVSLAIALPVYMLGLELLPKSLFRRFPYRALAALAGPLRLADLLLAPMHAVGRGVGRLLFRRRSAEQPKLFVAREDFKYLTIESERTGALEPVERLMIHNIVDFRNVTAKSVMVPLANVKTTSATDRLRDLLARSRECKFERWPVVAESGQITGLVNTFDVALDGRLDGQVGSFQRRIVKVNANEPAFSVLRKLRAARATLGLVIDLDSRPVGIVTWEDLIQRLLVVPDEPPKQPGAAA